MASNLYDVMYDFVAEGPEELTVNAGDVVAGIRECSAKAAAATVPSTNTMCSRWGPR